MKHLGVNFKSFLIKIDAEKQISFANSSREFGKKYIDNEVALVDLPGSDIVSEVESDLYNTSVSIVKRLNVIKLSTFDEAFLFYRWLDGTIYLSMNINSLASLAEYKKNEKAYEYHEQTNLFHPFDTLIQEIRCTGFNTVSTIDTDGNTVSTSFNGRYLKSFKSHKKLSNARYLKELTSWSNKEMNKYNTVITKQSGMDSALVTGVIDKNISNSQSIIEGISLHLDLNSAHWLGRYQKKIAATIANQFSNWRKVIRKDQKNSKREIYNGGQLKWLMPESTLANSFTTDLQLDAHIEKLSNNKPTLVLKGDRTNVYQHFNSTLAYKVSLFAGLVGGKRRFFFGKWGLRLTFYISWLFTKNVDERLTNTSLVFLSPSLTGKYTDKMPQFSLLKNENSNQMQHKKVVKSIAQEYISTNKNIDAAEFHSVVRDVLLYTVLLRNSNMTTSESIRLSLLGPKVINKYIGLPSQPFSELFSPKLNIRNRIKKLGYDIDSIIESVPVDKGLKKKFWRSYIKDHINIIKTLFAKIKTCI